MNDLNKLNLSIKLKKLVLEKRMARYLKDCKYNRRIASDLKGDGWEDKARINFEMKSLDYFAKYIECKKELKKLGV